MCLVDKLKVLIDHLVRRNDKNEIFKERQTADMNENYFEHVYYHCVDRPYGLISFEILYEIRVNIESSSSAKEKSYLRLLEDYIIVLDYLCHQNSRVVLINYINKLNEVKRTEVDEDYKYLIKLLMNALKLGLQNIDNKSDKIEVLQEKISEFQKNLFKFSKHFIKSNFVIKCCRIIYRLPVLAIIRRGFKIKSSDF
jgi:hypothetical protein